MRIITLAAILAFAAGSSFAATDTSTTPPAKTCGKGYVLEGTKCVHTKKATAATPAPAATAPAATPTTAAPSAKATSAKSSTKVSNKDPAGATAKCKDGTYSHATHASGTCSRHGGVDTWMH
jgi:predicted lipid-binding transport protein (Tim44 family)